MGDRHDYVALEWVKGEIAETLKQARQALEEFVENPEDSTRLRFCLTYVHQVHGTLQMVEFFGAALLAEEMEQLAQALLENRVNNLAESLEVMRSTSNWAKPVMPPCIACPVHYASSGDRTP